MKTAAMVGFGWLVPGGAYLLMRRYRQFAIFAFVVTAAFAAGLALHGGFAWPQAGELEGLDGVTAMLFRAAAAGKALAGGPYLLAAWLGESGTFAAGRVHEFGGTLLAMAGLFNALAIGSALDLGRREARS